MPIKISRVSRKPYANSILGIQCYCKRKYFFSHQPYSLICFCKRQLYWESQKTNNTTIIWKKEILNKGIGIADKRTGE